MWQPVDKLLKTLESGPELTKVQEAFYLSQLLQSAFFPAGYTPASEWQDLVPLSQAGREFVAPATDVDGPSLAVTALAYFAHHDILIDVERLGTERIRALLSEDAVTKRLHWPPRDGRKLYDRFRAVSHDRVEFLEAPQVEALLRDMPQGIYQLGHLLLGPLGIIDSVEWRFLPPTLSVYPYGDGRRALPR